MKKIIILIVFIFPLVGCVPAVFVAGGATSTALGLGKAVIYDQRAYRIINQGHNARSIIQYCLNNDPLLKGKSHITISIFKSAVLLVGQAEKPEIRDRAYQIVKKLTHFQHIYNQITIGSLLSLVQRAADAWITTKVRTAMLLDISGLHFSNFKVMTENEVVYLMGIVSPRQAAIAANIASQISGVKKVVKVFEYK
ncbi:MAG: BON domain-containing protein [Coxiella endosymbiont of Dermacentor nuttalli]